MTVISPTASFRIAAVQAAPVFLDRDATVDKACALVAEAGRAGAALAVFPECFIPAYPLWVWHIPAGRTHELRALYAELVANAVTIPSAVTARLGTAARAAGIALVVGVNERNAEASGTSLYNTLLFFDADGQILGTHRKLIPTAGERLVHARGDGSTLRVYPLAIGRLGGLICWENYMPLARYTLYAAGIQIYAAPTWDHGEPWLSTLRHIAKEGRSVVVGSCSAMRLADVPDRYPFKAKYLGEAGEWLNPGGSAIVDPDGKVVAGPAVREEAILYADIAPAQLTGPRWQLDVAGHYARPDVFELVVHRATRPLVRDALDPERD
jgi:nitrilase